LKDSSVNRRGSGQPTVNVYEFDMPAAEETLLILRFASPDAKWLGFVVANRLRAYTLPSMTCWRRNWQPGKSPGRRNNDEQIRW
jgi:hypothetical protein